VQLARLMARIDATEAAAAGPRRGLPLLAAPRTLGRRISSLAAATPWPVRGLLAAQLTAIALLGVLAGLGLPNRALHPPPAAPPVYRTLSEAAPPLPAGAPGRAQVRIVFADGATAAGIQNLLAGISGQIVAGPSPLGTYTVEVPSGRGADPLEVVLAHLHARWEVSFASPVAGGETER
jgi:hypothetical protein